MLTIPNIITLFRIVLVPFFIAVLYSNNESRITILAVMICLSGFSDVLDGFIARKFNMQSKLGAVLDPLADKLMQLVILLCLYRYKWIPLSLVVFLCAKEFILCCGALHLLNKGFTVSSDKSGKFATFALYLSTFIFVFLQPTEVVKYILFAVLISTAVYAFVDYSIIFIKNTNIILKRNEDNDREKQS